MAIKPKRPGGASYAAQRELVESAKKLDLAGIVKKTGSKPYLIPQAGAATGPFDQGTEMKFATTRPYANPATAAHDVCNVRAPPARMVPRAGASSRMDWRPASKASIQTQAQTLPFGISSRQIECQSVQ
jgi:hypothetical protein